MNLDILKRLKSFLEKENIEEEDFFREINRYSLQRISSAICLDQSREIRTGLQEVIFAQNKSVTQLQEIITNYIQLGKPFLCTRLGEEKYHSLNLKQIKHFYSPQAKLLIGNKEVVRGLVKKGRVMVVCAGLSDLEVGLEAYYTGVFLDLKPGFVGDVGVAGIHRLEESWEFLKQAKVLIVVAGMEGALPSVLAGLLPQPIIGVPTSVGYGANFQGIAPLLTMLNSCAPGIGVVNIDNGFGAMALAFKILKTFDNV